MSTILDQKNQIFGNIAAATTITTGLPNLVNVSSLQSANNGGDSIAFLTDVIRALIGFEALLGTLVGILSSSLAEIEREIIIAIEQQLKGIVSCGVDPSIPNFLKSTGTGIVIEVNKIDFFNLFSTPPNSIGGNLLYNNITNPYVNSSDLNTFLYGVIQDGGITHTWQGILDITFNSIGTGTTPNNTFTIKVNPAYNTKTLTDLNNDYINSFSLFNIQTIVSNVIDLIFGSIATSINKSRKQLQSEARINNVIDNLIQADAGDVIDDSYFTFTNPEVYIQQEQSDLRKNGIVKLQCCNQVAASIPISMLTSFNSNITGATSPIQVINVLNTHLSLMATQTTNNTTNTSDQYSVKLNFIQQIINNLIKAIVTSVISPKVILILMLNYKIINGQSATFSDAIDFLSQNRVLMFNIIKAIGSAIVKALLIVALKEIANLMGTVVLQREAEMAKNNLSQLLSLVGVPQDVLRVINGLTV